MPKSVSRKTFTLGSAAALATGSLAASGASAVSPRFTYAAGRPAPHQDITTWQGEVAQVGSDRMTVATDTGVLQEVEYSQRPFVWKDRLVPWPSAKDEFAPGQRVLLCGELESGSATRYVDLQQVWLNVPGLT